MASLIECALRENWRRLSGYALSLCGDRDRARDLLQSCALKALSARAVPSDPAAIRAWLFTVLRNCWIDEYRHTANAPHDEPAATIGEQSWAYEDHVLAEITVRQGMARLEAAHREVIALVDLAGFRYAEAASILDIPVGTVMSRLSRARLALLQAIETSNIRPITEGLRRATHARNGRSQS